LGDDHYFDVHGDRVIVTAGKYKGRTGAMRGFTSSGKSAYVRSRARREGEVLTVDVPDVDKERSFATADGSKKFSYGVSTKCE
jgi:ribosomal protein L24